MKHFPPVVCAHVVNEYLFGQFYAKVDAATLLAARIYLAPFEMLTVTTRTPDLCAELKASRQAEGHEVSESVCWIAAHALEQGLPVVTTDRQFRHVPGLQVHFIAPTRGTNGEADQEKRRPALAGRL